MHLLIVLTWLGFELQSQGPIVESSLERHCRRKQDTFERRQGSKIFRRNSLMNYNASIELLLKYGNGIEYLNTFDYAYLGSSTATLRAQNLFLVQDLKRFSVVQIFECDRQVYF